MHSESSQVEAPPSWRVVDFISDLHLQVSESQTFEAWARYMANTRADAVFILGDLFDVWVGDDAVAKPGADNSFETRCTEVLRTYGAARSLYLMRGNRDFLMGPVLMKSACATLLEDPCVLIYGGERWLLTHGDALCLADTDYQAFRQTVRSLEWQRAFIAKPLTERQQIGRQLRLQSQTLQRTRTTFADVDVTAALAWLEETGATRLIHGHTHRPADLALGGTASRSVLSDWELSASPPRAEIFRLNWEPGNSPVRAARLCLDEA